MKILFTTDLHGADWKYHRLADIADSMKPDVVVNGGDMLPRAGDLFRQHRFITRNLTAHFERFEAMSVPYLCYLGNDDLRIWDPLFETTCGKYSVIQNIAQRKVACRGMTFIGMNWVVDYPFRLKDRCRMDTPDYEFQPQFGAALLSTENGWETLADWRAHARTLPTIADELAALPQPRNAEQSVYVFHMPPAGLGLDVCLNGQAVGSCAIRDFLSDTQPGFSLHGHIHESPEMSGAWKANAGETCCIQPGQDADALTFVILDTETRAAERHLEMPHSWWHAGW